MPNPAPAPPCPCCGCTTVHRRMTEPPPNMQMLEAAMGKQVGYQGMYEGRTNLITVEVCRKCGHEMTEIRQRLERMDPRTRMEVHSILRNLHK